MDELSTPAGNSAAPDNHSSVLPEALRQQYLEVMGIQTWFDPALEVPLAEPLLQLEENSDTVEQQNVQQEKAEPAVSVSPAEIQSQTIQTEQNQTVTIDSLSAIIEQCQLCELHTTREKTVPGEGSVSASLMIITDAPVNNQLFITEDKNMLQAMLQAIGKDLSSVYLSSLVKCQPPEQRAPQTSEMICCDDYLSAQINLIQPEVILVLGEQACQQLLVSQKSLTDLRLRHHKHLGIPVYASYHPHALFNSSETKRKVWTDLLQISKQLNK